MAAPAGTATCTADDPPVSENTAGAVIGTIPGDCVGVEGAVAGDRDNDNSASHGSFLTSRGGGGSRDEEVENVVAAGDRTFRVSPFSWCW